MAQVHFTADTHFGHVAMIERGWRPQYASVPEMNADLIERWNAAVRPGDVVWHLGDFAMGRISDALPIVGQLHGTVHLIAGNHDPAWSGNRDGYKRHAAWLAAGFATIQSFGRQRIEGGSVMLSHFPYVGDHTEDERFSQYRLPDLGLPLLHGHVHGKWKRNGRQINVGVDVRDYQPVPLDEIRAEVVAVLREHEGTAA
jgi:calcineurin-like phosphoesterase family protein